MADLYDEIKDDIKEERLHRLWRRYHRLVIGGAVAVVLGTAIGTWWNHHGTQTQGELGDMLYQAHLAERDGKTERALGIYRTVLKEGSRSEGAADIAALEMAAIYAEEGNIEEMLTAYQDAAGNKALSEEGRQLAALLYAYNTLGAESSTPEQVSEAEKMIAAIPEAKAVWPYSVKEALALAALKHGEKEKAIQLLDDVKAMENAPETLKIRAIQLSESIRAKAGE